MLSALCQVWFWVFKHHSFQRLFEFEIMQRVLHPNHSKLFYYSTFRVQKQRSLLFLKRRELFSGSCWGLFLVKLSWIHLPGKKPKAVIPPSVFVPPPIFSPFQFLLAQFLLSFSVFAPLWVNLFRVTFAPALSSNLDALDQIKLSSAYHLLFVATPLSTLL